MNKQQLANKIWESANKMRSKIDANEYKDYILGFIFYKFLSDKEVTYLKNKAHYRDQDLKKLTLEDTNKIDLCKRNLGYYIAYDYLFDTWIDPTNTDFSVKTVSEGIKYFTSFIADERRKVFEKIFDTLDTGLSKLGTSTGEQTKAIVELLNLIKEIPMDGKQDYDVLGFVYEYLISKFAANAGKKAGEFYTPHEVSLFMAEIIAHHLQNREEIKIYDPTSGSGSLLINIGKAVGKYIDPKKITYYAQELKQNTYNLTRMNLVMRNIEPANIITRNGDTLEKDWPYFDDSDPENTYNPLFVDAVVSNPPYSQKWKNKNMRNDIRFKQYGLAPNGKADYAFLLHDLYHLKDDGIMTIVLPHGVLFRGKSDDGSEGQIRAKLIEKNRIDAIIGLPADIFFGTGIPTIVMVLKKNKTDDDILIVDASKYYIKADKKNKLQASDIRRIVEVVTERKEVPKFSRRVSRDEIRQNDYNLNIPRYVDSSEEIDSHDIYATMFGGYPQEEVEKFTEYWNEFKGLKEELFDISKAPYYQFKTDDISETVNKNKSVENYKKNYIKIFEGFKEYLYKEFITQALEVNINREEEVIAQYIYEHLETINLIDKYTAYQALDDAWDIVLNDLEIIQTEGFNATKQVDPNMVIRKKDDKEYEVQDGWVAHVLPFEIVQERFLQDELKKLKVLDSNNQKLLQVIDDTFNNLTPEELELSIVNDDKNAFVTKEVENKAKEIYADVETEETNILNEYLLLSKKIEQKEFINNHKSIDWSKMEANKDGIYTKTIVKDRILTIQMTFSFEKDSTEEKITNLYKTMEAQKEANRLFKKADKELHEKTKTTIENLNDEQVKEILVIKWIDPLNNKILSLCNVIVNNFITSLIEFKKKYYKTYVEVAENIFSSEKNVSSMLEQITGSDFDTKGLKEFQKVLRGEI